MAVPQTDPLFVEDFDQLLVALRLDGIADDDHAESECAIVENALRKVRLGFYDRLGDSGVSALTAIAFEPNPVTLNDRRRMKAFLAEVTWVKMFLVRDLPMYFLDGSGRVRENWNEEGLLRHLAMEDQDKLEAKLQNELDACLRFLEDGELGGGPIKASTIGPEETPTRVGRVVLDCTKSNFEDSQ